MVCWADHAARPGTDSQVVLGHLPAPSLGAGPRRGLRPIRGAGGRTAGPGPRPPGAESAGLADAARRADPAAGRRSHLRPRPARPQSGTAARTGGLPPAGLPDRRPGRALSRETPVLLQHQETTAVEHGTGEPVHRAADRSHRRRPGSSTHTDVTPALSRSTSPPKLAHFSSQRIRSAWMHQVCRLVILLRGSADGMGRHQHESSRRAARLATVVSGAARTASQPAALRSHPDACTAAPEEPVAGEERSGRGEVPRDRR